MKILHQQPSSDESFLDGLGVKNDARKFGFANLMDENKFEREIAIVLPDMMKYVKLHLVLWVYSLEQQSKDENVDVGVVFATQAGVAKHIGVLENAYNTFDADRARCVENLFQITRVDMNNMPTMEMEKKRVHRNLKKR